MRTVLELFDDEVRKHPDRVGVEDATTSLTYRELDDRAGRLADHLAGAGIGRGHVIGVAVERSAETIVVILGVMRAGCAYLPLDLTLPTARLRTMLRRSRPAAVLADAAQRENLTTVAEAAPVIRVPVPDGSARPAAAEVRDGEHEGLGYVLFTSGSTGEPKAVAGTHDMLAGLIDWHLGLGREDDRRTAYFAATSFDVALEEIFSTICGGGTLVVVDEPTRHDPSAMFDLMIRRGVHRLFLPTPALQMFAEEAGYHPEPLQLRDVVVGGEQLRITDAIRGWFRSMPGTRLHNIYGPTEGHVVTCAHLPAAVDDWPVLPGIGRPLPHVRLELIDPETLETVDGDGEGEIVLAGSCLARGYLNDPEVTARHFVRLPGWSSIVYRTGDFAARRDGELFYRSRISRQVKIGGYRIEPGEIEAVLAQHTGVRECAVDTETDDLGRQRLVGYVSPRPGGGDRLDVEELRAFCAGQLPAYMIPARLQVVPEMPLSASGKIDRQALRALTGTADRPTAAGAEEPATIAPDAAAPAVTPAPAAGTSLVELVATEWSRALGREVDLDTNVFQAGATSLLASAVRARLAEALDRRVPITLLFDNPSARALAGALDTSGGDPAETPAERPGPARPDRSRRRSARQNARER